MRRLSAHELMYLPRLVLADDHTESRAQLRSLLESEFDVVADVPDGRALVIAAGELSPDVIVSDISMPGIDGITAALAIRQQNPAARIVFVTVHGDTSQMERAWSAGALGYVLKFEAGDELVPAVHAALRCKRYVSRTLRSLAARPARHQAGTAATVRL